MRRLPLTWRLKAKYCQRESICRAMAPSTLSLFLTALMFAGAMGATKGLGETCTTGSDTCTSNPESVCDNVVKKCLIKQSQSCVGGFSDMCVSGAECSNDMCTCKGSVYTAAAATGLCTSSGGLYGLACTSGGSECSDSTVDCVADVCVCLADKAVDIADGTCSVTIINAKVGKVCTDADKATTCGAASTNLECPSGGGVCNCKTGYFGPFGGDCTPVPGKIGGGCLTDADCGATNDKCSSNVCACDTNYSPVDLDTCKVSANKVGGSCTTTSDAVNVQGSCDDVNALCPGTADGTCFCKTGYTGTDGATCAVTANTFGGACTGGPDVKGTCVDANGVCSGAGTCGCKATYSGAIGASCVADNKIGGACTGTANTKASCDDANALCTSSRCICKPGYDGSAGGTCTKIADNTFGGSCTADTINTKGTCADANALCSATTGGFCTCKANYDGYAGSGCAMPNKLGGKCTTMTKGTKGTCESNGAVCTMQVDGRCVMSGAKAVVASVTSLVLACIVCLLAIN